MLKTILLVDDDPLFTELVKDLLETHRYRVLVASNGADALSLLATQHVDVVVSDIEMPVMNGISFHARLLENTLHRELPFIFLTSTEDHEKIRYVREHPRTLLLRKTQIVEHLITTVAELTSTR